MGKRLDLIRRMLLGLILLAPLALTLNAGAAGLDIDEPAPALFSDLTPAQRQALEDSHPATAEPYVLRWRPATVQRDLLGSARGQGAVQTAAAAVRLNLFEDASYLAVGEQVISRSPGELLWIGRLEGSADSSVLISVFDQAAVGTVWADGRHFRFKYAGNGLHLIQELQVGEPYPELEPVSVQSTEADRPLLPNAVPEASTDDGSVIDVLVVYTTAAKNSNGGTSGILALIQTAVAEANQAYASSQINTQLRLAYAREVSYSESGDMGTDLNRLQGTSDGYMDDVHALRDTYKADLVNLIEQSSQYCGIANLMQTLSPSFENSAFSVVASACATGYYSFAHELGHNMGSQHDRNNAYYAPVFPYSYGYRYMPAVTSQAFRTIMAYDCSVNPAPYGSYPTCPRIQRFSNPNVIYNGQPTGVVDSADNARSINNARATVASFRTAPTAPPGAFTKSSPADGASSQPSTLTFSWGASSAVMRYELCLDTRDNDQCDGGWIDLGGGTSVTLANLVEGATYSWQVRAYNTLGTTYANGGDWWQFSTASSEPPGSFSKITPGHLATRTPTDLRLGWGASPGASGYAYCIDTINDNACNNTWQNVGPDTATALNGLNRETTYYWQVRASNAYGTTYADGGAWWRFSTSDGHARLLLVDDDNDSPDVSPYYADALSALGVIYDRWDTHNSDIEPSTAALDDYRAVVWFTGDEWSSNVGPGASAETALAAYLQAGNCLFISSQDYHWNRGLTAFMDTYLGVSSVVNDVGQTQVTGQAGLSSLGTVTLDYPAAFDNFSDKVFPDGGAGVSWRGRDNDPAGVYKDSGVYRTAFWGFPFEALSGAAKRQDAMRIVLNWCSPGFASPLVINELDAGPLDAVEIYNPGDAALSLAGWKVLNYASDGSLFATYTFPAFTLGAKSYVVVYEGSGANTPTELYAGALLSWSPEAGGAALVDPRDVAGDFLRWGYSSVTPPAGTQWSGDNPAAPEAGATLGRDEFSSDTDRGADWYARASTLGVQNVSIYVHKVYLPLAIRSGPTADPAALPGTPEATPSPSKPFTAPSNQSGWALSLLILLALRRAWK